jgi:hypothetical protein
MRATATAVMNISVRPPRLRARATTPTTAAAFTAPTVPAIAAGEPIRTGTASSQ